MFRKFRTQTSYNFVIDDSIFGSALTVFGDNMVSCEVFFYNRTFNDSLKNYNNFKFIYSDSSNEELGLQLMKELLSEARGTNNFKLIVDKLNEVFEITFHEYERSINLVNNYSQKIKNVRVFPLDEFTTFGIDIPDEDIIKTMFNTSIKNK